MFNNSKVPDTPRPVKSAANCNDDAADETSKSFLLPKITSTPKPSSFTTPPKPLVMNSRRYSLSDVSTTPKFNKREYSRTNSSFNPPGPLLASTKYSLNVSTFEDVKSPGLASRIVQYNEEAEREKEQRHPSMCQAKYGSLGLFPVVHLFKKKLPILEQRPRHVTVRVASPDYTKRIPEYKRKLLDGLIKPSGSIQRGLSNSSIAENSTGTRSVLDALKEISRKRIHAHEEFEVRSDSGKRIRTEIEDCTDSNKRSRDDSSYIDSTSPTRQASKKICMYDEYAASRSSMDFLKKQDVSIPKRKSISTATDNSNETNNKHVKLINAETQTNLEETNKGVSDESKADAGAKDSQDDKTEKRETVLKVFDDAPLERIRKNRLAALMGTLVGKEPILEPKPDYSSVLRDEVDKSATEEMDKSAVTPTTPPSPALKVKKHVRFNLPESSSDKSTTENSNTTVPIVNSGDKGLESVPSTSANSFKSTTVTSVSTPFSFGNNSSITTPSPVVSNQSQTSLFPTKLVPDEKSNTEIDVPKPFTSTSKALENVPSTSTNAFLTTTVPSASTPFSFGGNSSITTPAVSNPSQTSLFPAKPASSENSNVPKPFTAPPVATSPPKMGGFKFDLPKPAVPTTTSGKINVISNEIIPKIGVPNDVSKPSGTFNITTTKPAAPPTSAIFGILPSNNAKSQSGTATTSANSTFAPMNFKPPSSSTFAPPSVGFGTTAASINFGTSTTSSAFGTSTASSGFGTNTTSSGFGSSAASSAFGATTSSSGFGTSVSSSGFGTSTTSSGFGSSTASTGFGASTTSSGFGTSAASSGFGNSTASRGFGVSVSSANTNNFGGTTFGTTSASTTSNNIFGASTPPASKIVFGAAVTTTSSSLTSPLPLTSSSGFGSTSGNGFMVPATTAGGFSAGNFDAKINSTSFGNPSNTNASVFAFGGPSTTASSTFGAPATASNASGFGASQGFGANSTFGGNQSTSSFGGLAQTPFGGSFGTTTAGNNAFGGTNAATTTSARSNGANGKIFGGNSGAFGAPATTSSIFGAAQSAFVTTAAPFAFTSKTAGNAATFGSTSTTTASFGGGFGQNASGFNSQQTSGFGTPTKPSGFGNANSTFGGTGASGTTGFGTPQQPQQSFGSPAFNKSQPSSNSFGTGGTGQFSFNQQQPQNNAPSFGTTTTNQQGVFTFGSPAMEKPSGFNFAAPSGETPAKFDFTSGNSGAPATFGTGFGNASAGPAPSFGAPMPVAGGFSIGAGPPTSRTRIKGKRRT
ncbi:unnamed protein product [Phyllotreta striolata]|uniref:Uncharacterized protein n=1 Tax=Phyllotreta striolata TaxID=444603 RepID=A0A9N9THJ3_PHYSR|nr:unnamed protein product [Phyllotreta striolata]